jgi:hypothetical protein
MTCVLVGGGQEESVRRCMEAEVREIEDAMLLASEMKEGPMSQGIQGACRNPKR